MEKTTLFRWLIGPELLWMLLYVLALQLAKMNATAPHPLDKFLENLFIWVPLAVLLSFALWHVPSVERNWLLLRLWVAGVIGGHLVLEAGLGGHSKQGPGIGTAYIVGLGIIFLALFVGSILVKIKL